MDVIFLHGLESGPHGSKFQSMKAAGWNISAPDCEGIANVGERVEIARRALPAAEEPVVLVGSSFGGLTAARLFSSLADDRASAQVHGLLLLAPAFHVPAAESITTCHPNTVILHGTQDDVVPIESSRAFAARFGCELVEVEDGHRLAASHPVILRLLDQVAGTPRP